MVSRTSESLLGVAAGLILCANNIPSKPNRARTKTITKRERRELLAMYRNPRAGTWRTQPPHLMQYNTRKRLFSWTQKGARGYRGVTAFGGWVRKVELFKDSKDNGRMLQKKRVTPSSITTTL